MLNQLRRARADLATMNRLLPAAERIAADDGLEQPGAEHLLLAALDLDDGIARRALSDNGISPSELRGAIARQHEEALRSIGVVADDNAIAATLPAADRPHGPYRSEGSLQDAFQAAVARSKREGRALTSGDVLLAVTELERGTVARALDHLGVDRSVLREQVLGLLDR